jgi:tetratricopeptide (TPR) repeat protein
MNSNNLQIQKKKLLTYFKENRFEEVIKEGVKILEERQNDAQLIYLLGLSSINLQKFIDAEKFFKKLIFLQKTAENLYTLGNIQKKQKKFEEAIESFEEAIKLNPNFSEAYNNLGSAQKSLNKFEEAILSYEKSIALKANNVEACYNLATLNYFLENYNEASNYFKNIVNLKVRQEEICERFTICLFKTGKKNEVKDFVLTVISKFPRNRVLNNLLGQSLLALNSHKEGLSYIKNGAGFLEIDENGVRLI